MVDIPVLEDEQFKFICDMTRVYIQKHFSEIDFENYFSLSVKFIDNVLKFNIHLNKVEHLENIKKAGYIPIELIRKEGCIFYGLPMEYLNSNKTILVYLESEIYDSKIVIEYCESAINSISKITNVDQIRGFWKENYLKLLF